MTQELRFQPAPWPIIPSTRTSLHPRLRHVVTFDGARALSAGNNLTLACAGSASNCGCLEITGAIAGAKGSRIGCGSAIYGAENASTSAEFYFSECRVQATVELETIRAGGEGIVKGAGTFVFWGGGEYFLPSEVEPDVEVTSGAVVVCSQWTAELMGAVNVTAGGVLWFAGEHEQAKVGRAVG